MRSFVCQRHLHAFLFAAAVLVTACNPASGEAGSDRDAVARGCLAEVMASYDGKTYDALRQKIGGRQDSRVFRKHGHKYEVLVSVTYDVEHKPDGIQVDFDVFDGDDPPTMTPLHNWISLKRGQALRAPNKR